MSKSTKVATISSLVRVAARTEADFVETIQALLDEADQARTAEFFDRLNIPRSVTSETNQTPLHRFRSSAEHVTNLHDEAITSAGIQKFMDRHERKLKWHAAHPSIEGASNVALLVRAAIMVTDLRLERLILLLGSVEELTAVEWSQARRLMRHAYLGMRNHIDLLTGVWIDTMLTTVPRDALLDDLGSFYEFVDGHIRRLEENRARIEERRVELTVIPEQGYAPVKPPNYFSGDILGRGSWRQYWDNIEARAHHFRESMA